MNWETLISNKRLGQELRHTERHDERSEFKRDYDRLIFSAPFRRLQNKTQVFPLPGSIFVHNRLTHSLEVASVGMSLGCDVARAVIKREPAYAGTLVEELGTIVSTACLAHDLGNPPFGHAGERAIQTFFSEGEGRKMQKDLPANVWNDLIHFEGNANAFRLLTHQYRGRREGGFAMTYSSLASIVKYPYTSSCIDYVGKSKFGFFASEAESYMRIATELSIPCEEMLVQTTEDAKPLTYLRGVRHPLVYLVEAADDICYEIMDIEDAHKLKILSFEETRNLLLAFFEENMQRAVQERIEKENITDANEQVVYMRACVIGKLENECADAFIAHEAEIMAGTFQESLIKSINDRQRKAYEECTKIAYNRIYRSKPVLDIELGGYRIMETLMQQMMGAIVTPARFYSQELLRRVSSQYEIDAPEMHTRVMAVIDFISGMTDVFALDFYQKINGTSLPIV